MMEEEMLGMLKKHLRLQNERDWNGTEEVVLYWLREESDTVVSYADRFVEIARTTIG